MPFVLISGDMASPFRKYFRKSNKEGKKKKHHRRSFYNFLCGGGVNEEDRDADEEPIEKPGKEKTDKMGQVESKGLLGDYKAEVIAADKDTHAKASSREVNDKKKKEKKVTEPDFGESKGIAKSSIEGTDVDIKADESKTEKEDKKDVSETGKIEVSEGEHEATVKEKLQQEKKVKDSGAGIDTVDATDNIQQNGISDSSSDSESSNYTSCEEGKSDHSDDKKSKKTKKTKSKKTDSKNKEVSPSDLETSPKKDKKEPSPSDSETSPKKEGAKEETAESSLKRKKSGKNPFVRIQSKIMDVLSHQNFDAYSPAICIDFLKCPNLKLLSSLNKKLKQNKKDWIEEFLELQGSDALLDLVDMLGFKRVTHLDDALLLLESVSCIKTLMNSKIGLPYLVQHGDYLKKLVKGEIYFHYLCRI